jgi:acetyl-CoA synthetase
VREVEELSGRTILENWLIVSPASGSQGVDMYLSTSSAGGGLQMTVAGVVKAMSAESAERPSSMGKPSPLYHVALIHPDGTSCRIGEEGEVVIFTKGKNQVGLLSAYCTNGERIDPAKDGIYHTGDIAYEDEDGFYWYVGRNDDMIKCSGYRIGPFEIESVLNTHPSVRESAIIGIPDEIRGQIVCAAVKLREGYAPSDELTKELQTYVKTNTAPYKYPRRIFYLPELPKTTSGKIIRKSLRDIIAASAVMAPSKA